MCTFKDFYKHFKVKVEMNGFPQGLIPGQSLLHIFVSDMDNETEYTLIRFCYDTKLCGMRERWAYENLTKFKKAKCKVLHLSWSNPKLKYRMDGE